MNIFFNMAKCLLVTSVAPSLRIDKSSMFRLNLDQSTELTLTGTVVECQEYRLTINPTSTNASLTFDDTLFDIAEGVTVPIFDTVDRYAVVRMIGVNDRLFIESIAYRSAN